MTSGVRLDAVSDEMLVEQARAGSQDAFNALVIRYQDQAVAIAQGVLRNFDLARDAAQNGFAKAYFGLKNFRRDASFKTWLTRIVMNEAKTVLRKELRGGFFSAKRHESLEGDTEESMIEVIPSSDMSPSNVILAKERREQIERMVRTLPPREQNVFILRYFEEYSLKEISESLTISVGSVKAHLFHANEKFRVFFSKEGVSNE